MDLTPARSMWAVSTSMMGRSLGESLKPQRRGPLGGSTQAAQPASETMGVPAAAATSSTARELGVVEGPKMTSTWFSSISFWAARTESVVSLASSRTMLRTFWPAISAGTRPTTVALGAAEGGGGAGD